MVSIKRLMLMKRLLFISVVIFSVLWGRAQTVSFTVSDGLDNISVKSKIENSVSRILSEINAAQAEDRNLDFYKMGVNLQVQKSMESLWQNAHFMCTDDVIVEHCITTGTGYQVRNIPLIIDDDEYQEAVISFTKQGEVESFYLSISMNLYMNVIKSNLELTDLRRRQLILDYVEQFRTAYNQKDINFLNQVFSEDALIITGKVITTKHREGFTSQKIQYNKQSKEQYIANLRRVFQNTKYIKVQFDDIEVMRHPVNPNFYGVTLLQGWTSNTYHDEGYLFLLWDFTDENAPQIHVRTWQPNRIGKKLLPRDEVFSLSDFDI